MRRAPEDAPAKYVELWDPTGKVGSKVYVGGTLNPAAWNGHFNVFAQLVYERGCSADRVANQAGAGLLHYAAAGGNVAICRILMVRWACRLMSRIGWAGRRCITPHKRGISRLSRCLLPRALTC